MRFPYHLKYLHEKPLPRLPLWNPGNERTRLYLPLYWLRMVEHRRALPPDTVKFECHWQMTCQDVKEYLEKLYQVPILDVRIEIEKGKYMKHPKMPGKLSPPLDDKKYAYVQLRDAKFKYPKLKITEALSTMDKELKAFQNIQNKQRNKELGRMDLGGWFS